ncbi:MAG: agmatinase family protein, partial [Thermonemataceae bacterium]|nr:agmatinase family protein [Thermonemataceae bacterium]
AWHLGVAMLPFPDKWFELNETLREEAETYIEWLEDGKPEEAHKEVPYLQEIPEVVNKEAQKLNDWVRETALHLLNKGKMVALLGGDHSTPLGLIQALATKYDNFAILQIDAHADLREAYEGFEFSHASIMYNALKIPQMSKLVQIGIRDYCQAEAELIADNPHRITTFFDQSIKEKQYQGATWDNICDEIIAQIPDNVYISFDIDGLDPKLCPHTGTPVAGGFEFFEIAYLLKKIVLAGKKIIAFDLVEVACGEVENEEWDANVAARMLFKLCNWMGVSQQKLKLKN